MMDKKAQLTMIGIVIIFATVVVYTALFPAMQTVINDWENGTPTPDTTLVIVVNLIPLLIALGIIITLFSFVTPFTPG